MQQAKQLPVLLGISTMVVLYIIGAAANIPALMYNMSRSSFEIAFLPIVLGLIVVFVSNRLMNA